MFIIHSNIFQLRDYFKHTIENIDRILSYTTRLNTYNEFNKEYNKYPSLVNFYNKWKRKFFV